MLPRGEEWMAALRLCWLIEAGTPTRAFLDATRVVQIINNLLSNACKFSPGGGAVVLRCFVSEDDEARTEAGSPALPCPAHRTPPPMH